MFQYSMMTVPMVPTSTISHTGYSGPRYTTAGSYGSGASELPANEKGRKSQSRECDGCQRAPANATAVRTSMTAGQSQTGTAGGSAFGGSGTSSVMSVNSFNRAPMWNRFSGCEFDPESARTLGRPRSRSNRAQAARAIEPAGEPEHQRAR